VTAATQEALDAVSFKLRAMQTADLGLDALSRASFYFLAAIGLAITFGVMRALNMAHGEFIMMGACTRYVVQLWISNYTLSIIVLAFAAGVAMERLVVRHLYKHSLETLPCDLRHLRRAATPGQDDLWHSGAAPDPARMAQRCPQHPVPPEGHHRPQGSRGGELIMAHPAPSSLCKYPGGPGAGPRSAAGDRP